MQIGSEQEIVEALEVESFDSRAVNQVFHRPSIIKCFGGLSVLSSIIFLLYMDHFLLFRLFVYHCVGQLI